MPNDENDEIIDPVADNLDPETLRAVKTLVEGYSETNPEEQPGKLTDYRAGKHDILSALMATLTQWLAEIENKGDEETSD